MIRNSEMEQDFFTYLPSEITIDILSRLQVRTVMRCKCVSKSWGNLIETHEFFKSYKSFPSLAIFRGETVLNPYKIYQLEDVLNHNNDPYTSSSYKEAFNFDFPHRIPIRSSADGLLFLCHNNERGHNNLIVCNPVTREYINLLTPRPGKTECWAHLDCYGFGVSKTSGQYKLVRVYREKEHYDDGPHCQVYTLGMGSWRSIDVPSDIIIIMYDIITRGGAFLNGILHWLALSSSTGCPWIISCFDLESELFTTLSIPPHYDLDDRPKSPCCVSLSTMREESLCLCDGRPDNEIVIWLMKEYGDDKSWTKQYVIPKIEPLSCWHESVRIIKVFNDGDVLLKKMDYPKIICYSNETKTFEESNVIGSIDCYSAGAVCYTPGFLQLKTLFPAENGRSF